MAEQLSYDLASLDGKLLDVVGTGAEALIWGAGLLLAGMPFHFLRRR